MFATIVSMMLVSSFAHNDSLSTVSTVKSKNLAVVQKSPDGYKFKGIFVGRKKQSEPTVIQVTVSKDYINMKRRQTEAARKTPTFSMSFGGSSSRSSTSSGSSGSSTTEVCSFCRGSGAGQVAGIGPTFGKMLTGGGGCPVCHGTGTASSKRLDEARGSLSGIR